MIEKRRRVAFCLLIVASCARVQWTPPRAPLPSGLDGLTREEPIAFFVTDELASSATRDGRFVAFASDKNGNLDIWLRDYRTDSTLPWTRDPADDFDPAVSPDSKRIAFVSRREDAKGDIYIGDIDARKSDRRTFEATRDRQPVWAPDGRKLYFTSSTPGGLEFVSALSTQDELPPKRISATPGFDPAPDPTGRFVVYTAPDGVGGRRYPHLVAIDLVSGSTRAITADDGPAGFARFFADGGLVYVRFADDDNGDGNIDGRDNASLWRLDVDLAALFEGRRTSVPPIPLTAGSRDELFPDPVGNWLYLTQTARLDQDIVRLPRTGMFPIYDDPGDYLKLARSLTDARERWFAYRTAIARTRGTSDVHARAWLQIANLHVEQGRPHLGRPAFEALRSVTSTAAAGTRRAELRGIAEVELVSLDREAAGTEATTPRQREANLRRTRDHLERLAARYTWAPKVVARIDLELAEVVFDRGDRVGAIAAFDDVVTRHGDAAYSAARAMIRRAELLGVAFDPDALSEVYEKILRAFPDEARWVSEAAERIVDVQIANLAQREDGRAETDALRRVLTRTSAGVVRIAARRRLVRILIERQALDDAVAELDRLFEEAHAADDRRSASNALGERARIHERLGDLDRALADWGRLRTTFADLPGVAARAREAITRVALQRALREEAGGRLESARASYAAVIDNDSSQVRAHRRYLALSAAVGQAESALAEAAERARKSMRTPVARYVHGLALTWTRPPRLEEARDEIEEALELNPQLAYGYLTRGWIREMLELAEPDSDFLERAIEDYGVAARLNVDSDDRALEAEIALNLGNARWRLATKTNDVGNIGKAFTDYMDRLSTGVAFETPQMEMVFWERLGRAAAWTRQWAVSAMAGREAIAIAERIASPRAEQLWGNLALAYAQAGEGELAAEAFEAYGARLSDDNLSCKTLSTRNRAISKLVAARASGAAGRRSALNDLGAARTSLAEIGVCRPQKRYDVSPGVPDASRAPYGFDELTELDVNLAFAERAHYERGDRRRAAVLRAQRLEIVAKLAEDADLMTLGIAREHAGLLLSAGRIACKSEPVGACGAKMSAAISRVDAYARDERLSKDAADLLLDRSAVVAAVAESTAARATIDGVAPEAIAPKLLERYDDIEARVRARTSTLSNGRSGEAAPPDVAEVRRSSEALARLLYARGLWERARATSRLPGSGRDLGRLLASLDDASRVAVGADPFFSEAADVAPDTPRGRKLAEAAIGALALFGGRDAVRTSRASSTASFAPLKIELALASGDAAKLRSATSSITTSMPAAYAASAVAVVTVLDRAVSEAVARGDVNRTLQLVERRLLVRHAVGSPVVGHRAAAPEDRALARYIAHATARLGTAVEQDDKAAAAVARKRLAAAADEEATAALHARLHARPADVDTIRDAVSGDELVLVPFNDGGELRLLTVSGSTNGAARLALRSSGASPGAVRADVARARSSLSRNQACDPAIGRQLHDALIAPIADLLERKRVLVLADAMVGGPVPDALLGLGPSVAISHISSVTSLVASRQVRVIGATGVAAFEAPDGPPLVFLDDRVTPQEALTLASGERRPSTTIASRPLLDRLVDRPRSVLVVAPELTVEPSAPSYSTLRLAPARPERPRLAGDPPPEADMFRTEIRLEDLRARAASIVLTDVVTFAPSDTLGFDLALALGGIATAVVVPTEVPRPVAAGVVIAYARGVETESPARALQAALAPVVARFPSAGLIHLVGAPGLSREDAAARAKDDLRRVERLATRALKKRRYEEVVRHLIELRRLQTASGKEGGLKVGRTYELLVSFLQEKLQKNDFAAEIQREYIAYLDSKDDKRSSARARATLAEIYSAAADATSALSTFDEALEAMSAVRDQLGAAQTYSALGEHHKGVLRYDLAAQAYDKSIDLYRTAGALDPKHVKSKSKAKRALANAAKRVLGRLGDLYLLKLGDPVRAQAVYERLLELSGSPAEEIDRTVDLARVARRRGDFFAAAAHAQSAQKAAKAIGQSDLELKAVIEEANVAWYQGDYARGHALCRASLSLAEANLRVFRKKRRVAPKADLRRKIFALSVCGLLHMSTRNFEQAKSALEEATTIAVRMRDDAEVASQNNNLGRVYLEFGRFDDAIETFRRAMAIDERLNDNFGLSYDLRNLGTALAYKGAAPAEATLGRALELSRTVRDTNNELRALFALAELSRAQGRSEESLQFYLRARPIAESLQVKDLAWQIHRSLGVLARQRGEFVEAERELRRAIGIAASITGRAAPTDFGPHRYAAFDDLVDVMVRDGRHGEAFELVQLAQGLAQTELLGDRRIRYGQPLAQLLVAARTEVASSTSSRALTALAEASPRVAARLQPVSAAAVSKALSPDDAVIAYRPTEYGLAIFVVTADGLTVRTATVTDTRLRRQVRRYGRLLSARADMKHVSDALAESLLVPIADLIESRRRLTFVVPDVLRYVGFAALPFRTSGGAEGEAVIDRFTINAALDVRAAVIARVSPMGPLAPGSLVAFGASRGGADKPALDFADKELDVIREPFPQARTVRGASVGEGAIVAALTEAGGVVHFAGHTRLDATDPLAGRLEISDGGVELYEVLSTDSRARLVVLSSCESAIGGDPRSFARPTGEELLSLAQSFIIAGTDNVLASTSRVSDVAAAILMKRFYRAARTRPVADALRDAQLVVRTYHPHPAWWANFTLISGGE